jgi:UPF0716 protein FxsA
MTTRAPFPYEPPREHEHSAGEGRDGGTRRRPGPGRSRRAGTLIPLGIAAWVVLEIWLLIMVGQAAGGFTILALLAGAFLLGGVAIKRAGRRAWRELSDSVQRAQDQASGTEPPEQEAQDGSRRKGGNAQAMLGGLLLMLPGLISDAVGLLLLFPPTARMLSRGTRRVIDRRAAAGFPAGSLGDAYEQARKAEEQVRMHRPDGRVVQGEVIRDDEPPAR